MEKCDFIRNMVKWMDSRPEYLNQGLTINQLVKEYNKYLNSEVDLYGNKIEE